LARAPATGPQSFGLTIPALTSPPPIHLGRKGFMFSTELLQGAALGLCFVRVPLWSSSVRLYSLFPTPRSLLCVFPNTPSETFSVRNSQALCLTRLAVFPCVMNPHFFSFVPCRFEFCSGNLIPGFSCFFFDTFPDLAFYLGQSLFNVNSMTLRTMQAHSCVSSLTRLASEPFSHGVTFPLNRMGLPPCIDIPTAPGLPLRFADWSVDLPIRRKSSPVLCNARYPALLPSSRLPFRPAIFFFIGKIQVPPVR